MQPSSISPVSDSTSSLPESGQLSALLIQVGTRIFGIPLQQVRYVAPIPSDFVSRGQQAQEHFAFEGEPLSYIPLWDTLGLSSLYGEFEEIKAMLPQRRQDHLDWMGALEDSIRNGTPFAKARNPRECAFGKWFYGYHPQERRLELLLGQFEEPHAAIHALADRLLGMIETGQASAALEAFDEAKHTTLAKLLVLFDEADKLLIELQREIAVIVSDGENSCALGADKVRDIVDIPSDRIRRERSNAVAGPRATAGLVILDDQSIVPLLNWPALCLR